MLRTEQRIFADDAELVRINAVQEHVDAAEIVGGQVDFLPIESVVDVLPAQHLRHFQQQRARTAGRVYYGGVFDTARYECKYKNIPISKDFRDIKSSRKPYLIGRCVIAGMIHA